MHTFFLPCCRTNSSRIDITRMPWGLACANREDQGEGTGASSPVLRIATPLPKDGSLMDPDPQRPEAGAAGKRFRARLACLEALAWQARTANRTVPCLGRNVASETPTFASM
jgi:hypothetical protein